VLNLFASAALAIALLASPAAFAGENTVTLGVKNMDCATCPHTVRASLQAVPGVKNVLISYKEKTAVVTYDDTLADMAALTMATTNAGYPSSPKS
jgi:mercuric ion binding protein